MDQKPSTYIHLQTKIMQSKGLVSAWFHIFALIIDTKPALKTLSCIKQETNVYIQIYSRLIFEKNMLH